MTRADLSTDEAARPPVPRFFWERFSALRTPEGADLAALRRGIGREAGTVPEMWRFYTYLNASGSLTKELRAEHLALTLFAIHQQSKTDLMHHRETGLGTALLALKRSGRFSEDALDRRFAAAATATSLTEIAVHLRGLVNQLRLISQPLDYTKLVNDLTYWQSSNGSDIVRRRWGGQYFASGAPQQQSDRSTNATRSSSSQ